MNFLKSLAQNFNWASIVIQIVTIAVLALLWHAANVNTPLLNGALTYYIFSLCLRTWVPRSHRKGIEFIKNEEWENAISSFENSYTFFQKHRWVDKYRYLTLLSSSRLSYREMALNNIAFCYSQAGNRIKSREYYHRIQQEFPSSNTDTLPLQSLPRTEPDPDDIFL